MIPLGKLPKALDEIGWICRKYRFDVANIFHAGDGNLHAALLCDERDHEEMERIDKAIDEMLLATIEMGGTVTGEHGIGRVKKKFLPRQIGEGGMLAMRAIKRALDPNNILNPGLGLGD